jgi:hypothetical protein
VNGVWQVVKQEFSASQFSELYDCLNQVNRFRNTRVAHVESALTDEREAWEAMQTWLACLGRMSAFVV